jgi:hypothetical protein
MGTIFVKRGNRDGSQPRRYKGMVLKIVILWLVILFVGSFWLTVHTGAAPLSLTVIPEVPRENEPIVATFKIDNPSSEAEGTSYKFYVNGELLKEGTTMISPGFSKIYHYVYENPLELGEQVNFMVKGASGSGSFDKAVSLPSYPPQVWSSFVSFASFSTSVMSSMSSMTYYQSSFGADLGLNVGIVAVLVLISLLIFQELSPNLTLRGGVAVLGRVRSKFSTLTWILLVIFIGMVFTRVAIILSGS